MWRRLALLLILSLSSGPTVAQSGARGEDSFRSISKPTATVPHKGLLEGTIVVKFKDGVPLAIAPGGGGAGEFRLDAGQRFKENRALLESESLTRSKIEGDLERVNRLIAGVGANAVKRLFSTPVQQLASLRSALESSTGRRLAHLTNYYAVELPAGAAVTFVNEINRLDIVEIAYLAPKPENALTGSPASPDYSELQRYLEPAPAGIDARYAWQIKGGHGEGVTIADVEQGWLLEHEDFPKATFADGEQISGSSDHGTAVLGEMLGLDNGIGVTGIASRASFGVVSVKRPSIGYSVADAIVVAAQRLHPGDVILIEQHAKGPGDDTGCQCNCGQYRYIPMEYWPAEFDAIKVAIARGISVVEAGGNGGQNLDDPRYNGAFDRNKRDSGAILVAASNANDRAAACFTSYGSRLDVHAWGEQVVSAGYGDLNSSQRDKRRQYTGKFGGTSGASPIVTGAVTVIQGIRKANSLAALTPKDMRDLLARTGTPSTGEKRIGPMPDLRRALDGLLEEATIAAPAALSKEKPFGGAPSSPDNEREITMTAPAVAPADADIQKEGAPAHAALTEPSSEGFDGKWQLNDLAGTLDIKGNEWRHPEMGIADLLKGGGPANYEVQYRHHRGVLCDYRIKKTTDGQRLILEPANPTQPVDFCPSGILLKVGS